MSRASPHCLSIIRYRSRRYRRWAHSPPSLAPVCASHLDAYGEDRNEPDKVGSTQLSLICTLDIFQRMRSFWAIMRQVQWTPEKLAKPNGSIEGFLECRSFGRGTAGPVVYWREIGFNMCHREPNFDRYESLPAWARKTLADHESDQRPKLYSFEELEQGRTYDKLWNAAQMQLVKEGRIHNYLRNVVGKTFLGMDP